MTSPTDYASIQAHAIYSLPPVPYPNPGYVFVPGIGWQRYRSPVAVRRNQTKRASRPLGRQPRGPNEGGYSHVNPHGRRRD